MERITKEFSKTILNIDYSFGIEFSYYEGNSAIDPTEQEDCELYDWEFTGIIHAWDNASEIGYEVEPNEFEKLIDIEDLFTEAIS